MLSCLRIILNRLVIVVLLGSASAAWAQTDPSDPLSAWNEGTTKTRIITFVAQVTNPDHPAYRPASERIAVFDNDGTLWAEKPLYVQQVFAVDRIRMMVKENPELASKEPYQSVIRQNEMATNSQMDVVKIDWLNVMKVTHSGMSQDAFRQIVADWIKNARNAKTGRRHIDMIYLPMLQLLRYLEANGFTNYIVSGGETEFMRPWTKAVYGIDTDQVIGTMTKVSVETDKAGQMTLIRKSFSLLNANVNKRKVISIDQYIGKRPILAVGNSDGDYEMLLWTSTNPKGGLSLIVHHTDAAREFQYDRKSAIGELDKGLNDTPKYGWQLIDMKNDWSAIFPDSP